MNPELSRRVASIINYLAFNKMIPGGSRLEFAIRVDLADKFEDLLKEDQEAIARAEREIDRKEFEYVEPVEIRLNYKCPKGTKDPNTNECMDGHSGTTVNEEKYSFSRGSDGKLQYALNPKLSKEEKKVYKLEADINKHIRDNKIDLDSVLGLRNMQLMQRSLVIAREIDVARDFKINGDPDASSPNEERIHLISSVIENPDLLKYRDPFLFNSVIRAAKSGKLGKEVKKYIGDMDQVSISDDKLVFDRKYVNDQWKARRKEDFRAYTTEKEYVDTLESNNVDTNDKKYDSGLVVSDKIKSMSKVSEFYYDMIDRFGADDMTDNRLSVENKRKMVSVLERVNEIIPNFPVSKIQIGDTSGFGMSNKNFLAVTINSINTVVFEENYFESGNGKKLVDTLIKSIDKKSHPPGSANFESILVHELGHVLENTLEISNSDEVLDIHSKLIDSYDKKHAVSRYALDNDNEFFAETFLCAILPNDATKDNVNVKNMREFLNKISKKTGGKPI